MITDDLKEIINKNLPSLAAGEMSKYIEQAEKEKEELKSFKFNTEVLNKQISNLTEQFQLLKSNENKVISKSLELATKEEELKIREFNLKVAELTYQLASEKSAKSDIFKLVETFVRNPRSLEVMSNHTSENQAGYSGPHGYIQPSPISKFEQKTTEKLDTKD